MKKDQSSKEECFLDILFANKAMLAKICSLYSSPGASFDDLYQEIAINIWQGLDKFRGESKLSTWLYRTAINTCITYIRRNSRYSKDSPLTDEIDIAANDTNLSAEYHELQRLIATLKPLDRAIITLWLDEKSYDDIAMITGLSKANVAIRLHRIKESLSKKANL